MFNHYISQIRDNCDLCNVAAEDPSVALSDPHVHVVILLHFVLYHLNRQTWKKHMCDVIMMVIRTVTAVGFYTFSMH